MIDEKKIIKKLDNRIDIFVKQHPEEKDCLECHAQSGSYTNKDGNKVRIKNETD